MIQRCPRLAEAARAGELSAGLSSLASTRRAESEFLMSGLEKEVVAELDTPWAVSVKKWRCGGEGWPRGLVYWLCFSQRKGRLLSPPLRPLPPVLLLLSPRDDHSGLLSKHFSRTSPPYRESNKRKEALLSVVETCHTTV